MVLFCPARTSTTWQAIERAGRFCVCVLGAHQQDLSQRFGSRDPDKFAGVRWSCSPAGAPVLDGVLAWIDATIETVHDGGDHVVVHGRVTDLECAGGERPLLFYRGGYTVTEDAAPTPAFGALLGWLGHDAWI
jgi:3-hydroxy-9,10-secoandrosta-1,3,5(10)-triene-9,17-dione monooxygenase reductase component